jgi:hypothetical protein
MTCGLVPDAEWVTGSTVYNQLEVVYNQFFFKASTHDPTY